jgi:hypothetical protein
MLFPYGKIQQLIASVIVACVLDGRECCRAVHGAHWVVYMIPTGSHTLASGLTCLLHFYEYSIVIG